MTRLLRMFALALLALVISACSSTNPVGPTPVPIPTASVTLTVISEETKVPLAGATVTIEKNGAKGVTNSEGKISFETIPSDTRLKIEYPDYQESVTVLNSSNVYGLLGPRAGLSQDFIVEFIFGEERVGGKLTGSAKKPKNNRLDVVLDHDLFRTSKVVDAFRRVCQKIEAVGYGCTVLTTLPTTHNGTLALFRYGGETGLTDLRWAGKGSDHTWTMRGDLRGMEYEPWILSKLISPLALSHHSSLGGAASKLQLASDFSDAEKRAIKLYMPRTQPTCYEDMVQLPIPGMFGDTCLSQAPFAR